MPNHIALNLTMLSQSMVSIIKSPCVNKTKNRIWLKLTDTISTVCILNSDWLFKETWHFKTRLSLHLQTKKHLNWWRKLKVLITAVPYSFDRFQVLTFWIKFVNNRMSNTPVLQLKYRKLQVFPVCTSINMANIYIVFKLLPGAIQYIDIYLHSGF
jgi:hypothetical protein